MCVGDCEERVDLGLAAKFGGDLEICIPYVWRSRVMFARVKCVKIFE